MMQTQHFAAGPRCGRPDAVARAARRRLSRHGPAALLAMVAPAVLFPVGLCLLGGDARRAAPAAATVPWQLWVVAVCGTVATLAGAADWLIHRSGETAVSRREHRAHVAALAGGGLPLFGLMALASLSAAPGAYLVPVLAVLILTVLLIAYDEFVFHRRCGPFETLTHRLLTFGNGAAFLAWAHWCFVSRGVHG